ncbi:MAG: ribosomal protection-like ABC-F family protein [Aggregatilineales bacterium]
MPITEQVLDIRNLTKHFGAKPILESVSLTINRTDRIALVGENGAGKSTLAKLITGALDPDAGEVRLTAGIEIGYLPQEASVEDALTVRSFIERAMGRLDQLKAELAQLESNLSVLNLPTTTLNTLLERYGEAQADFARLGGYESDYRIDQVFAGLDLGHIDKDRPLHTLSGGEKTRLMLAGLLLRAPDLLILDEPTNHLDFAAIDWLEDYLLTYSGALLVISHDRRFLNRLISQIAELSPTSHQLTIYHGNYDFFVAERARLEAKQQQAYEAQQDERKALQRLIKAKSYSTGKGRPLTDNDKFAKGFFAGRVEKSQSREINAARNRLADIEASPIAHPGRRWQIHPDFAPDELSSREVIRFTHVAKSFGDRLLFTDFTTTIGSGEHIVLYGPNGIGKTTVLKLILGIESPDAGTIHLASGARLGYLDQETETLNPADTLLEAYCRGLSGSDDEYRADLHKYGLFTGDQMQQPVDSLSLGQKRKLQLARLIAQRANVLLLDEPTNHLDLASVEQFEEALRDFPGTILAISHDRTFIERVGQAVWTFQDGRIVTVAGQAVR